MTELKDKVLELLGACLQSEFAAKLVQSDAIQSAFLKAFSKSSELRQIVENRVTHMVEMLPFMRREVFDAFEADVKAAREKAEAEHQALADRLTKAESLIAALEAKLAEIDAARADAAAKHDELNDRAAAAEAKLASVDESRAKAQAEHEELNKRIAAVEAKVADAGKSSAELEDLNKRLSKLEVTCDPYGVAESLDTAALPAIKASRKKKN